MYPSINVLYLIIIIVCWTISPFLKKIVTKKIKGIEYNFAQTLIILTFLFFIILYGNYIKNTSDKIDPYFIDKLNTKEMLYLLAISAMSLLPAYLFIKVIHEYEISFLEPVLHSSSIVLTAIIGSMFFNESFGLQKSIGILLVIGGIVLLNYSK
jgi:uncharacterized membrane protein